MERTDVAVVMLPNTPDVTLGVNKDGTLEVTLDVTDNIKLRDVCDFGIEDNTVDGTEDGLKGNVMTLVWKLKVTLGVTKNVTLVASFKVKVDVTLVFSSDDAICVDLTLVDDGVTLAVKFGVTLRVTDVLCETTVLLWASLVLFAGVTSRLVNVTDNLVKAEVSTCVTSELTNASTELKGVNTIVLLSVVTKGVTDEVLLGVTVVLLI